MLSTRPESGAFTQIETPTSIITPRPGTGSVFTHLDSPVSRPMKRAAVTVRIPGQAVPCRRLGRLDVMHDSP